MKTPRLSARTLYQFSSTRPLLPSPKRLCLQQQALRQPPNVAVVPRVAAATVRYLSTTAYRPAILRPSPRPSNTTSSSSSEELGPYAAHVEDYQALSAAIPTQLLAPATTTAADAAANGLPHIPSETEVVQALEALHAHCTWRIGARRQAAQSATSAVLSLDSQQQKWTTGVREVSSSSSSSSDARTPPPPTAIKRPNAADYQDVAALAYRILSAPAIFLTPDILEAYVRLHALIRDANPLPAAFTLYTTKPTLTISDKTGPVLTPPNPAKARQAIPTPIADTALHTAIDARDMMAALDLIDTSYAAAAFRRAKIVRRVVPLAAAALAAPVAIYSAADLLAGLQGEVDRSLAIQYAFAGLLAYSAFAGSIGAMAVLSANDQMVRVTWLPGTPLRERWFREEERRALDTVAQAWGFGDVHRRGFEEGPEWELLREVVERKGMRLDVPELLEGMQ